VGLILKINEIVELVQEKGEKENKPLGDILKEVIKEKATKDTDQDSPR
jgi:hypothetical protein